jgi:hypothetical protein
MLSTDKQLILDSLVMDVDKHCLKTKKARKALAGLIAISIGMVEGRVLSFVEEMAGLDFCKSEDRLLFLEFARAGL